MATKELQLMGVRLVDEEDYGKSAYEIAKDHGFEGTEEEWVASLRPVKGVDYNTPEDKQELLNATVSVFQNTKADSIQHKTGSTIVASNSAHLPLNGFKLLGKTTQASTTGKNLFDGSADYTSVYDGTCSWNNEALTVTGYLIYMNIPVKPNTTYSFSCESVRSGSAGGGIYIRAKDIDAETISDLVDLSNTLNPSAKFTTPSNTASVNIMFYGSGLVEDKTNYATFTKIQLEYGDTATDYEPYTGGIPSPNPDYPQVLESAGKDGSITVKAMGKNILDVSADNDIHHPTYTNYTIEDGHIVVNGKTLFMFKVPVTYGTQYAVSVETKSYADTNMFRLYEYSDEPTVYAEYDANYIGAPIDEVIKDPKRYVYSYTPTAKNVKWVGVSVYTMTPNEIYIQLEIGTTATAYEPYKEPQTLTVPTPNGLPGIGEYRDEIDFERGVYVQRIKELVLKGTESFTDDAGTITNYLDEVGVAITNSNLLLVCCNYYPSFTWSKLWDIKELEATSGVAVTKNFLRFVDNVNFPGLDISAFKQFLADKYAEGNPVIVQYVLAEPIVTPLTAEQLEAYENTALHTYAPTTVLTNDANAEMEFTYYTPTTAVQMVHGPADKGKTFTIDEHGCVTLIRDNPVIATGQTTMDGHVWNYRKWANGFAECWCSISEQLVVYSGNASFEVLLPFPFLQCDDAWSYPTVSFTHNTLVADSDSDINVLRNEGVALSPYADDFTDYGYEVISFGHLATAIVGPTEWDGWLSGALYVTGYWKIPEVTD